MKNVYLFLAVFFISITSIAQSVTIKGTIVDETSKTPLEAATVFAEKVSDSTLITYSISDRAGLFLLETESSLPEMRVNISFTGYAGYSKVVKINSSEIDLGTIPLGLQAESLSDVVITATRAPITIKKDTLEFNVKSFKTKKDANVEDLLKQLPGVEVDPDGTIKVNGKPVNKILVNGKPFFGNDPTIATRNLTKDIIKKIQVTDTKTDSEAFTGEDGEQTNKTINLTIDEDKNKGIFGRVAAGAGTDERFEYAGLLNYFDNDLRVSVLGGGNNINSPGFSFGEIQRLFSNTRSVSFNGNGSFNVGGRSFGGGQGITNSRTAGVNFANELWKKTDITTDYFYSASNSYNDEVTQRENILPDNRFITNSISSSDSNIDSHTVNARFRAEVDSTFVILFRPEFSYNTGLSNFDSNEESRTIDGELTNQSEASTQSDRTGTNFQGELDFTKKYGKKGGFVRLGVENNINKDVNERFLFSNTEVFGDTPETITRNQFTDGENTDNGFQVSADWRIPLIEKKLFLNAEYTYEQNTREDNQSVFDFNETNQNYSDFNLEQSTDFENKNSSSEPELGLQYQTDKLRAGFSAGYIHRTLESDDALRDINFENNFDALTLSSNFRYNFTKQSRAYISYRLRNDAPSVNQLSPFVDVSNPLNTIQGNPNLSPSNNHNIYLGYNSYDFKTQSGVYSYGNATFTNDRVVAQTTVDENFVRNTTYTNVNGNYNLNFSIGVNKQKKVDSLQSIRYGLRGSINANRNVNFNNAVQYASRTVTYSPSVNIAYILKDKFEFRPSYTLNYTENSFNLDLFEGREYVRHTINLFTTATLFKKLEWVNDVDYNYNADVAEGFEKSILFWNSSLLYSFYNDAFTASIKAYDILKQNNNTRRTATQDYIQDTQSTVLQRYVMFGLSYKFNTLGKKGETREFNWRRH